MVFEIQEISIQMEVGSTPHPVSQGPAAPGPVDEDAIVARCVTAVVRALRETRER
ncbi:MAG TPA: DUF5908 family protein [Bryobacteraceae bacterium]|nr:DUF5908 family protein [Bryobacteraceae bacterium]